jgi:predicted acyltransferase
VTTITGKRIFVAIMSTTQPTSLLAPVEESNQRKFYSGRLMSIDIFRGFAVAGMILVDNPGSDDKAYWPIQHSQWNGWTPADLIFPSFLLLVGISLVFSFSARLRRGESRTQILIHPS